MENRERTGVGFDGLLRAVVVSSFHRVLHKQKATMMRASSYATALLAAALFISCQGKPWGKPAAHFKNLFGLSASSTLDLQQPYNPLATRGGADDSEPEGEEKAAELYLPGLLDAVVTKSAVVRFCNVDAQKDTTHLNPNTCISIFVFNY